MLVEDRSAFIEQVEVRRQDRRAEKRRRRRVHAEIEALRAQAEARIAAEALRKMEDELAALSAAPVTGPGRRLLAAGRRLSLEHQVAIRSWWWYRDRFWWDDEGLDPRDVRVFVLDADLSSREHAEALAEARATVLGDETRQPDTPETSPLIRFAVWCRDRG
ncbi:MAG: hypothetical protein ACRDPX_05830, partial [Gaiellaceae bacterium]